MLYEQIQANKRKTWYVMVGFFIFFLIVGISIGLVWFDKPQNGAIMITIFGVFYIGIMYLQASKMVLRLNHAEEIDADNVEFRQLWNVCEEMALIADVPMPRVYIIHDDAPNAFATGISPEDAAVAATTGLVDRLTREELEGVIAHEFAHVRNYDIRLSTIAFAMTGVIAMLANVFSRSLFYSSRSSRRRSSEKGGTHPLFFVIAIIIIFLSPMIATMMRLALSRNREYLADATAVEFTRNPNGLIQALRKISNSPASRVADRSSASFYFSNPFREGEENERDSLFSTHPATSNRIRRLEEM